MISEKKIAVIRCADRLVLRSRTNGGAIWRICPDHGIGVSGLLPSLKPLSSSPIAPDFLRPIDANQAFQKNRSEKFYPIIFRGLRYPTSRHYPGHYLQCAPSTVGHTPVSTPPRRREIRPVSCPVVRVLPHPPFSQRQCFGKTR